MGRGDLRQQEILKELEAAPMIPVAELAETLQVTMVTIRKDLEVLEKKGLIVRIHGGAALAGRSGAPIPYSLRETIHKSGKKQVARAACSLIHEGDSILLESSTTTVALCHALLEREELLGTLTIITNSFYIAQLLKFGELCRKFFFLGGWSMPAEGATQGLFTAESIRSFCVDCAFLGGAALNRDFMLSAYYESDMYFQKTAIEGAKSTAVLLDSSKYPTSGLFVVSDMAAVDYLVTDIHFTDQEKKLLEQRKVAVVYER